jgi:hypothetical protein
MVSEISGIDLSSVDTGHVMRQNIMVAGAYRGGGSSPRGRQGRRDWEPGITFQSTSLVTYFL